jgi:hypothetical protein
MFKLRRFWVPLVAVSCALAVCLALNASALVASNWSASVWVSVVGALVVHSAWYAAYLAVPLAVGVTYSSRSAKAKLVVCVVAAPVLLYTVFNWSAMFLVGAITFESWSLGAESSHVQVFGRALRNLKAEELPLFVVGCTLLVLALLVPSRWSRLWVA